ncbi:S9 family peptidase, partial [bacterium]|nr:S9 family peptidase [bacterium]
MSLSYPVTEKVDQVDEYFGVNVADPYRWLEFDTAANVGEWVAAQNKVTDAFLEQIPFRSTLKSRYRELFDFP